MNFLHLELTSRCNKACWMCGRRKMEREHPELCDWGDMPLDMVSDISFQVKDSVVQFHNNGEPTLYPNLKTALLLFGGRGNIRQFNTNGKLLMEKADEIIGNLEILTISVIQDDPEAEAQYEIAKTFIEKKRSNRPVIVFRVLGQIPKLYRDRYKTLGGVRALRTLHIPEGSRCYEKLPSVPEIGICLDLLTHLAIDRKGDVSMCVRFDPARDLVLGNIQENTLDYFWHHPKRLAYIETHLKQGRSELPGCKDCDYWGVPNG